LEVRPDWSGEGVAEGAIWTVGVCGVAKVREAWGFGDTVGACVEGPAHPEATEMQITIKMDLVIVAGDGARIRSNLVT
jgi:hypothetical protein